MDFGRLMRSALFAVALATTIAGGTGSAVAKPDKLNMSLPYPVGSVIIVNSERRIYYVAAKGEVLRYPVAVGKVEELWMGRTFVSSKAVDPRWIPVDGSDPIEGGDPENPLGQRALYLDWSLLRIHGTPSRGSVGRAVSNGCIRMLNEDVIDLFERVHIGAPVFAIQSLRDPQKFETVKVGEKVYANPEERRIAKEAEAEAMRTFADERALWDQPTRGNSGSVFTSAPRRQSQPTYSEDWGGRSYRGGGGGQSWRW
jgi:hypothetical protein